MSRQSPSDPRDAIEPQVRFRVDEREVIHETLEGESVLVHLGTGAYFSLLGSATVIWALVVEGRSAEEIVTSVQGAYAGDSEQIAMETMALLGSIVEHRLATPCSDGVPAASPVAGNDAPVIPYISPKLEAFEDMRDLLLLDPIHETADQGWPKKAE